VQLAGQTFQGKLNDQRVVCRDQERARARAQATDSSSSHFRNLAALATLVRWHRGWLTGSKGQRAGISAVSISGEAFEWRAAKRGKSIIRPALLPRALRRVLGSCICNGFGLQQQRILLIYRRDSDAPRRLYICIEDRRTLIRGLDTCSCTGGKYADMPARSGKLGVRDKKVLLRFRVLMVELRLRPPKSWLIVY
jgi:hypothetical protein